jgi:hypothetical protein
MIVSYGKVLKKAFPGKAFFSGLESLLYDLFIQKALFVYSKSEYNYLFIFQNDLQDEIHVHLLNGLFLM